MVDPCDQLFSAGQRVLHPELFQQPLGADLYAVAEANRVDAGVSLKISGDHCHRIHIVQKQRVGANRLHVAHKGLYDRNGAQRTHNAADPGGISDRLPQPEVFGNLEICDRTGIIAPNLNRVDHKIRAAQRVPALLRTEIGGEPCMRAGVFLHRRNDLHTLVQQSGVNIIQCDLAVPKHFGAEAIADDISDKYRASRAKKRNFRHTKALLWMTVILPTRAGKGDGTMRDAFVKM